MFDLICFGFEIFEDSGLFDDIIGELLPFHIAISVDVNFIEQVSQVSNKRDVPVGGIDLPEFEVFFGDHNKLFEIKLIVFSQELLLKKLDGELVKVESHIGDHFVIILLDSFIGGTRGVNGVDVHHVTQMTGAFCSW